MSNGDPIDQSERVATQIPGLDTVLKGGVFGGGIYIVQGAPGAGKTIFGNQICFSRAANGARALYVTLLAESHARMLSHMRRLEFFDERLIPDQVAFVGAFKILEEEGLKGLLDMVRREVRTRKTNLLVLDGLITVHEKASSDLELKKFVHELQTQAVFTGCTMFLLTSAFDNDHAFPPEHTMVDGLIELQTRLHGRRAERQLLVHKLRGSGYLGGAHSFRITDRGIIVFPRIEAVLANPAIPDHSDGSKLPTGIAGLDAMLGGGVSQGSVTLITGPAGSGKTTAGLQFLSACTDKEPGLLFGFHENPPALRIKARALRLPFDALVEQGSIAISWRPATEAVLDETCADLLDLIRTRGVRRLFLDGADGFERLTDEKHRIGAVLAAMCNELRGMGVTALATAETDLAGMVPGQPLAGLALTGLSPVAENIVVLRLAAVRSGIHRLVTVLKARDSQIDMKMRRFDIGESGIAITSDVAVAETVLRELVQQAVPSTMTPTDARLTGD
ncbi:MAG TPA: ATPase domain-containing protein [Xanthobacteraceae bacterium]|nr:ATPase domain-containing protein [Xanthobacteraceae bacterium]